MLNYNEDRTHIVKNFVLHNPTKVLFGANCLEKTGSETVNYSKNVLLVYGQGSIKKNGVYAAISRSLKDSGCTITEYSGVQPNPTLKQVKAAIDKFRKNNCEVICAVGGGSVLDCAKAISCGVPVAHDIWKFFTAKKSIKSAIPLICVSTLAGSGSENNSGMVITNDTQNLKFGYGSRHLFPKVSLLDPETTYSVSNYQTACGCVDIICHLTEIYCNSSVTNAPLQHRIIEGLMTAVIQNCEIALINRKDYTARAQLMWASALALGGITSSGLGRIGFPMHLIEHSLAALHNTTHGAGLAIILPAWMKHEALTQPERIAQLGKSVFQLDGIDNHIVARQTAHKFKEWFVKMGCPVSLSELGIQSDDITEICENTKHLGKTWKLQQYTPEKVQKILKFCA